MDQPITINAVAFPEGEIWIVQGIEYDICARAKDPASVPAAFMRAVAENACICEHLGRKPLEGVRPAPDHFKAMFDMARTKVSAVGDQDLLKLPISAMDIRLAQAAA
jgi:hypothetical protein